MVELDSFRNFQADEYIGIFEKRLASTFHVDNVIAVSSGTAAIHLALAALDVTEGDEVLVPALAVTMSIMPVLYQRAKPVFYDYYPGVFDIDIDDLEKKITNRTKAIVVVYMWGRSIDVGKVLKLSQKYQLPLIEDACQAQGSMWKNQYLGTFGDFGCFSLKTGKLLSTGEGGYLFVKNNRMMNRILYLRNHGTVSIDKILPFSIMAWNYRLSAIQAFMGINELDSFEWKLNRRQYLSREFYVRASVLGVEPMKGVEGEVTNGYSPVFLWDGSSIGGPYKLSKEGIPNSVGTFLLCPANERKVFVDYLKKVYGSKPEDTPNTKNLLRNIIAPVLYENTQEEDIYRWIEILKRMIDCT